MLNIQGNDISSFTQASVDPDEITWKPLKFCFKSSIVKVETSAIIGEHINICDAVGRLTIL